MFQPAARRTGERAWLAAPHELEIRWRAVLLCTTASTVTYSSLIAKQVDHHHRHQHQIAHNQRVQSTARTEVSERRKSGLRANIVPAAARRLRAGRSWRLDLEPLVKQLLATRHDWLIQFGKLLPLLLLLLPASLAPLLLKLKMIEV